MSRGFLLMLLSNTTATSNTAPSPSTSLSCFYSVFSLAWQAAIQFYFGAKENAYMGKESKSHRMVWDTNVAVSLSRDTNMAAVTSCENTLGQGAFS